MEKYQYYIILEINNGVIIEHKDLIFSENKNYRYENGKCFCEKLLNLACSNKIGFIAIDSINFSLDTTYFYSIRNAVLNIEKIQLISELIIFECSRDDLAKPNIFIPDKSFYGEDIDSYDEDIRTSILKSGLKQSNLQRSYLAIYFYLVYNDESYISDKFLVDKILISFFKKFLENEMIFFLANHKSTVNGNKKETCVPFIINYIYKQICNNIYGLNTYFLDSTALVRDNDLKCSYGLSEYETEIMDKIEYEIIWHKETNKWNQQYIKSLKIITEEKNIRVFLKVSYDYPVINSIKSYNPL